MSITRLTTNGVNGSKYDTVSADNYYMEPIATTLLASSQSTVSFTNIPQGYKHLQIRGIAKNSAVTGTDQMSYIRCNGDSGSNYSWHGVSGYNSATYAYANVSQQQLGVIVTPTSNSMANIFGAFVVDVLDYSSTNKFKTFRGLAGDDANTTYGQIGLYSGLWQSTAPISSIEIGFVNNLVANSRFSLFGVKG